MESKAHYTLIGTFVLVFLLAGLSFFLWLSGNAYDQEFDEYVVSFDAPVRGVQESAEVRFSGIKVGEVTQIRLDPDNPNKVLVKIEVFEDTPVDVKSYGQLEAQGLTGLNYVQIFSGGVDLPLAKDADVKGAYVVEGRRSQIDSLLDDGGSVVESVQKTLNSVLRTLDDKSIQSFQTILSNIEQITSEYAAEPLKASRLEQTLANIDRAAKDVSVASVSVDQTALDTRLTINNDFAPLVRSLNNTVTELDATIVSIRTLAERSTGLVDTTNGAVTDFSAGSLKKIEDTTVELKELLTTLNRVADELERNPAQFIVGEKREIVELPR